MHKWKVENLFNSPLEYKVIFQWLKSFQSPYPTDNGLDQASSRYVYVLNFLVVRCISTFSPVRTHQFITVRIKSVSKASSPHSSWQVFTPSCPKLYRYSNLFSFLSAPFVKGLGALLVVSLALLLRLLLCLLVPRRLLAVHGAAGGCTAIAVGRISNMRGRYKKLTNLFK